MLTKEEAKKHDRIFINELAATLEDKELGYGASKTMGQCTCRPRLV